ncbi:uncharacterized protein SCODWIG_00799 [Saccharomycodes ludwigii]|uniref:Rab-GAP TBC domain-containing protein n=1 Tax=Saccharomycodes ludwigii TaxID=36035 RepID=A0A376B2X8_9ASCO|nr:uncharacterized protein SCODWIG_00799 [Saccharomycodes ludwigii]
MDSIKAPLPLHLENINKIHKKLNRKEWIRILSQPSKLLLVRDEKLPIEKKYTTNIQIKDESQIKLDVERSFHTISDESLRDQYKEYLYEILVEIFKKSQNMHYYQGFHDIISVFVIVFTDIKVLDDDNIIVELAIDKDVLVELAYNFSLLHLRDFLMDSLDFTVDQLRLIPFIVKVLDHDTYKKLNFKNCEMTSAISFVLTLFSHEDLNIEIVTRIFELVIVNNSIVVVLFIYALLIIELKGTLIKTYQESLDEFNDHSLLLNMVIQKHILIKINSFDWEDIFTKMDAIIKNYEKIKLCVNEFSVLKTSSMLHSQISYDQKELEELLVQESNLNIKNKHMSKNSQSLKMFVGAAKTSLILAVLAVSFKVVIDYYEYA